ncbi:MAG: alkaline phosphatase D family protein [Planctomycetaceae bacterium]|nr:alkaline phosphatase D family protein [Planctomycetaceae bacterium]
MTSFSRRNALKLGAAGSTALTSLPLTDAATPTPAAAAPAFASDWHTSSDRVFVGESFWSNPMEDWQVKDGAAECTTSGGARNIQLITHQLAYTDQPLEMTVEVEQTSSGKADGGAGFRVGVKSELNEYRSNSFSGGGIAAGVVNGELLLGRRKTKLADGDAGTRLKLVGTPQGDSYQLELHSLNESGSPTSTATASFPVESVIGNVALVSNFDPKIKKGQGGRYRFRYWTVDGAAFDVKPERKFGPILWSMYTLSDSRSDEGFVLKMSALTPPLGEADNDTVELLVQRGDRWKSLGHARMDKDAWVATFRVINWDESAEHKYRLVYRDKRTDGKVRQSFWEGTIKANPSGRPLRLGALTCQNHYGFPYEPVAENLLRLDPDMLYFSGDQIYESHGGFGLIREPAEPAILNYLRKFYMFGWAFRDAMKDRPVVCIPDDHDVFQGNIWGEGGAAMKGLDKGASSKGGYREPARMVNAVHRTCVGHHPDFFDPTPCEQNISVYYGDLVYGNVSFAILGDRQFKSGPERVETGSGRADHVRDQNVDTSVLDKPGLILLGERQEAFLKHWVEDWRGHSMKVLLSQTVFSGLATHHGGYNGYLKADLDSGGWPQTARDNAIRIITPAMPLHINGDQHLTSLSQYGVDKQRDSFWSFCTPAIAAGYPRWWRPDEMGMPHENRPQHGLEHTGEYLDGFGNKTYVYAIGNPVVGTSKNRYQKAHEKGSGFGMVTIDTQKKVYLIESFRFLVDATDGDPNNQFPGWPVTLHQAENAGDNKLG